MVKASVMAGAALTLSLALASYGYGQCRSCGMGGCGMGGCGMGGCGMMPMMGGMMPMGMGMMQGPCGIPGCVCGCPAGACACATSPASPAVQVEPNGAAITCTVPESALVTIDGVLTRATGASRTYLVPALTPGRDWHYRVTVSSVVGGKEEKLERVVTVRANDRLSVDFTPPITPEQRTSVSGGTVQR